MNDGVNRPYLYHTVVGFPLLFPFSSPSSGAMCDVMCDGCMMDVLGRVWCCGESWGWLAGVT